MAAVVYYKHALISSNSLRHHHCLLCDHCEMVTVEPYKNHVGEAFQLSIIHFPGTDYGMCFCRNIVSNHEQAFMLALLNQCSYNGSDHHFNCCPLIVACNSILKAIRVHMSK